MTDFQWWFALGAAAGILLTCVIIAWCEDLGDADGDLHRDHYVPRGGSPVDVAPLFDPRFPPATVGSDEELIERIRAGEPVLIDDDALTRSLKALRDGSR